MRSAIRSKIFHVLFALIILAVFLLPVTVSGDGTAIGLVQFPHLLAGRRHRPDLHHDTVAGLLSCPAKSRPITSTGRVQTLPRWKIWLGKWFGIFIMHAVILIVSAIVIFF